MANTDGNIQEHSKEKVGVYENYLECYLSVLTNTNVYKKLFIWEPFAGEGKDKEGNIGSALKAKSVIEKFVDKGKKIELFLNDKNSKNCKKLQELFKDVKKFKIEIVNDEADNFFQRCFTYLDKCRGKKPNEKFHNLFFIDPHGYKSYSSKNLQRVLNLKDTDCLIFIPTNHIYRFSKKEDSPAQNFAIKLGISKESLLKITTSNQFSEQIKEILKQKSNTNFVYSYKLTNQKASNSSYHLFFITKNIVGARKYLESSEKIKEQTAEKQGLFFKLEDYEKDANSFSIYKVIKKFLKTPKTNKELYKKGIEEGILPKKLRKILKDFEKQGYLNIHELTCKKRGIGAFYLNMKEDIIKVYYE